jgi:hypothetical protein
VQDYFPEKGKAGFLVGPCRTSWDGPMGFPGGEEGKKKNKREEGPWRAPAAWASVATWPCTFTIGGSVTSSLRQYAREKQKKNGRGGPGAHLQVAEGAGGGRAGWRRGGAVQGRVRPRASPLKIVPSDGVCLQQFSARSTATFSGEPGR